MKFIILLFFLFYSYQVFSYSYISRDLKWYDLKVLKYDITDKKYNIKVFKSDSQKDIKTLLNQNNLISWVNWVFFCPSDYKWCETDTWYTYNERYVEWKKFAFSTDTQDRRVFAFDKDKNPFIYQSFQINETKENDIFYWLWNEPLLLFSWSNMVDYYVENNLLDSKMKMSMDRNFICRDKERKNVYFWIISKIKIVDLPYILLELWCYDAINLDAWLSTNLVYNGRNIIWPTKRWILDGIWIEIFWLDTQKINLDAEKISQIIIDKINSISPNDKSRINKNLKKIIDIISSYRSSLYDKNSKDIFDTNFVWEIDKVWYEIKIDSLNKTKKIYLLNSILDFISDEIKK